MSKPLNYLRSLIITALFSSIALAAMLDDIRESSTEAKGSISTAHMVYLLDRKNPESALEKSQSVDGATRKIAELSRNMIYEADTTIDCSAEMAKAAWTDLRDTDALRKQYNLPKITKINFPADHTILIKSNYEMMYTPPRDFEGPNNADILLTKQPGPVAYYLDLPYYGIIDTILLDEERNPVVSEISQGEQKLIQINVSYKTPSGAKFGTIQCDPKINYRYRSIIWTDENGDKTSEITAGDYRDVNGIPYPFSYVYRQFVDGQLYLEESYNFQKVEFNIALNEMDFKIFVPRGTPLTDIAISKRTPVIGLERWMGIDDALTIGRNMAQNQ